MLSAEHEQALLYGLQIVHFCPTATIPCMKSRVHSFVFRWDHFAFSKKFQRHYSMSKVGGQSAHRVAGQLIEGKCAPALCGVERIGRQGEDYNSTTSWTIGDLGLAAVCPHNRVHKGKSQSVSE